MYDIGMVYKKKGRYYLAVDSKKLLTFAKGRPIVYRGRKALQKEHSMSVRELCAAWKITVEFLDRVVEQYLLQKQESQRISVDVTSVIEDDSNLVSTK